jgi:hypothetical protein
MDTKLSTTVSVTSTYTGEFAKEYIAAMLQESPTIGKNLLTIKPNIKFKEVVKVLGTSGLVQNQTCDFSPTGSVTLTERILEPKRLQVNLRLCKESFRSDWEAIDMGFSAWDTLPKTFADFLIANVIESVAAQNEHDIWQYGAITGFTALFKADSNVVDVTKVTGLTSATIQVELAKMANAVAALENGKNHKIFMAKDLAMLYLISLGGFASNIGANGYKGEGPQGLGQISQLSFAGIPIEVVDLPAGEMVALDPKNAWIGFGLLSDQNAVQVIDQTPIDGSDNVNIVLKYSLGVQYGIGSSIIYYN